MNKNRKYNWYYGAGDSYEYFHLKKDIISEKIGKLF